MYYQVYVVCPPFTHAHNLTTILNILLCEFLAKAIVSLSIHPKDKMGGGQIAIVLALIYWIPAACVIYHEG